MTKKLISIVGPTAIGKTALSILLAKYFETEIISADSRQFYKEMSIGTAVPSYDELQAIPQHFIQHKSVKDYYTVGDFEKDAIAKLNSLFKSYDIVVMVGGSGLYSSAITKGIDTFPAVNTTLRQKLNKRFEIEGLAPLQKQLKILDKISYGTIDLENPHRVIRVLEICLSSGIPYSSFLSHTPKKRPFKTINIGLNAERDVIYTRINQRVDDMIKNGLLSEVKKLLPRRELKALNTIGYKELFTYLDGTWDLDFAVSEIKKNTRRYAKRQLTWYRKDKNIYWFNFKVPTEEIISFLEREINNLI